MITGAGTAAQPDPITKTRINETRYTRTYSRTEVVTVLLGALLEEAGVAAYRQSEANIGALNGELPEQLTIEVVVPERSW